MPNYDLECSACGHSFTAIQAMDAKMPVKCPNCKKKKARRVFRTSVAIRIANPGEARKNRGRGY